MEITWDVCTRYCVAKPALSKEIVNCVMGNKSTVRKHILSWSTLRDFFTERGRSTMEVHRHENMLLLSWEVKWRLFLKSVP